MSIRKIIDWAIQDQKSETKGTIVSEFYECHDDANGWGWACDVDLGGEAENVLRAVPVASNNRDVIYAEQGKSVSLTRMGSGKWSITGLSKTQNSTVHWVFVAFSDDLFTITGTLLRGNINRPLTYGELGTSIAPYGYGTLPYGIQGKFDYYGNFIEILER